VEAVPYGYKSAPAPMAQQPREVGPEQVLREGIGRLIGFMDEKQRPSPAQLRAFVDNKIAPYFDFAYMTQWIAGPKYRSMSPEQKEKMEGRLQGLFLGALVQRLGNYSDQQVRFLPPRRGRSNDVTVGVGIIQPDGYPAEIDFRFYRSKQGWRIFDVSANGSSALVHFRQKFKRDMRQRSAPVWSRRL
jgi:phospholipid transport system substrate-binding protein